MSGDLFASSRGDLAEALRFIEKHGTPLTGRQVAAVALLRTLQARRKEKYYEPIINTLLTLKDDVTPPELFIQTIEKMTLGGLVTGKVRASKLFGGGGDK
jgi:hypothetical protein